MANELLNSVCEIEFRVYGLWLIDSYTEHTVLVTETGVEVLTAANENSPGGPVPMPRTENVTS